jgi:hypothetical protein
MKDELEETGQVPNQQEVGARERTIQSVPVDSATLTRRLETWAELYHFAMSFRKARHLGPAEPTGEVSASASSSNGSAAGTGTTSERHDGA